MRITFKLYLILLILTCLNYHKGWSQSSGSLVINELMINPNNVVSLPAFKFIVLGYQNSTMELNIPLNKIYLTSKTFSLNDDGYEDELEINYELIHSNYIISVEIYNEKGQLVKKLAHQNFTGTQDRIIWDGKTDAGQRSARGHYISLAQIFNHNDQI
jgi:hypothetical protein